MAQKQQYLRDTVAADQQLQTYYDKEEQLKARVDNDWLEVMNAPAEGAVSYTHLDVYKRQEHALDPVYAKNLGVDIDNLYVSQPSTGEEALEIADMLTRSGAIDIVVVDSVAALVPKSEIEGLMGDSSVGVQARLMSQALRKLAGAINKTNTVVVFINQLREKIGVMFGSPETTTGGKALKFYASVRLDVRRIETIKVGDQMIGNRTRIKVVKNKVAPPFKMAEFEIYYGEGISEPASVLNLGTQLGLIVKSGAWFSYKGEHIGQGRDNSRQYLMANPEILEEVKQEILKTYRLGEYRDYEEEPETAEDAAERVPEK